MKKNRQLHLWIGLITSLFILVEAITGLLLSEPWLIGQQSMERGHGMAAISTNYHETSGSSNSLPADQSQTSQKSSNLRPEGFGKEQSGIMGFVRQLHEGKIDGANLKVAVDLTAIGLIILTITGISMSIRVLRAQRIRKSKLDMD